MPVFCCPRCGQNRSKGKLQLCNVCWLLDDLIEEHERGDHDDRLNPSCGLCKPRHADRLDSLGAGVYYRLMTAPPLDQRRAKYLLRADREGIAFFARYGPAGSRTMIKLRDEGHLTIEWDDDRRVPVGIKISATSRHKALELLASNVDTHATTEKPRARAERSQSTSHASCTHERTPKARAKCRAARMGSS